MKTVKSTNPLNSQAVRLISGRCSPDYSYGIEDPHDDIQKQVKQFCQYGIRE